MTCRELLQRFTKELEQDVLDWDLLNKLTNKCGEAFAREAGRALARRATQIVVSRAWALYRGALLVGKDAAAAYGMAVETVWRMWRWFDMKCGPLADVAVFVAEAVARYQWPAKWPFLAKAAIAAEENDCELPDAVAERLGSDEWARLEAFLEQKEGVVEVAGRRVALVRDGRYIGIVV
jgi:predicted DCC family thiol-disulfide oxidoreductase YuxK